MFDQFTFPNGLKVIGEPLSHIRSCSVGCMVHVGSRNESEAENGLSHFIEHMVFKGTTHRTARQIAEEMDMAGGQLNAFTSKEYTCFYAKVTDEELPLAVDILSDLTLRPTFDAAELEKERGVVLEEIDMCEDTPDDLVMELLAQTQYSGSLHMPILGPAKKIRSYQSEDLRRYWAKHYQPENMVVAIAGHYDWDALIALVQKYFDAFPKAEGKAFPAETASFLPGQVSRSKDTEQLHIAIGYPGVRGYCEDHYTMEALSNLLGGGMSSRLFQHIREELGLVYSVCTIPVSYMDIGSLNIYAATSPENGEIVITELKKQVDLLLGDGITEKEFLIAKNQMKVGYLLGLESSSGRMQSIGRALLLNGKVNSPDKIVENIEAVTMEAVMELAHRVLRSESSASVVGRSAKQYLRFF